jgi:hypothetical protein
MCSGGSSSIIGYCSDSQTSTPLTAFAFQSDLFGGTYILDIGGDVFYNLSESFQIQM